MHKVDGWNLTGTYTSTRIRLTGSIEQRDGYASDAVETVELATCDRCGAVVLYGGSLDTLHAHDRWHDDLSAPQRPEPREEG